MDDCIFCKMVRKEIAVEMIYEDDAVLAFLDVHPIAPGHALVIPKIHAETLLDMRKENVGPFFESVQHIVGMVQKGLSPEAFTLGFNHGRWAGQAVEHMHFHIIPRWKNDGGKSIHSVVSNPPQEDLQTIGNKIRAAV